MSGFAIANDLVVGKEWHWRTSLARCRGLRPHRLGLDFRLVQHTALPELRTTPVALSFDDVRYDQTLGDSYAAQVSLSVATSRSDPATPRVTPSSGSTVHIRRSRAFFGGEELLDLTHPIAGSLLKWIKNVSSDRQL